MKRGLVRGALFAGTAVAFMSCGSKSYSLSGEVADDAGAPLSGVTVDMDGETAETGSDGKFTLALKSRPEGRKVLDLTKDGYFDQVYAKTISDADEDYIQVVMLPREFAGSVDAEAGGEFNHGGTSFRFPPNAFIGSDGSSPSGTVDIYVGSFTPDAANFGNSMPGGDFQANSSTDGAGVLTSFGALAVEAEDEDGQELTIREAADVCMPIPGTMLDKAPDTMEVWGMGSGGKWDNIGMATRDGSDYCFFLSGTDRVNCDFFSRMATLQGNTCEFTEDPVGDIKVTVNGQMSTQSNSSGFYEVLVPSGIELSVSGSNGTAATVEALAPDEVRTVDLGCVAASAGFDWCAAYLDALGETYTDDLYDDACFQTCKAAYTSCLSSLDDCQDDVVYGGSCTSTFIDCTTGCWIYE